MHPNHLLGTRASKNSQDWEVRDPGILEVILHLPPAHTMEQKAFLKSHIGRTIPQASLGSQEESNAPPPPPPAPITS